MIWGWLGAIVIFGVLEAATAGLVSIWFVAGAAAALAAALVGLDLSIQFALFLLVSGLTLLATRPMVKRLRAEKPIPTNLDRVLGMEGRVTETVDNAISAGAVYVDGKTWSARSTDGSVLPKGQMVRIVKMEGVKLFVEKVEEKENAAV